MVYSMVSGYYTTEHCNSKLREYGYLVILASNSVSLDDFSQFSGTELSYFGTVIEQK